MAENKNAVVNETAIENGNAALTERLEDAAERMAEAEKATAQVAEEQKQRLAEQEQSSELLQKEEEQRKAQAQEAAKSVATRAAAVLDYTENYRQNQKLEKAARTTVSKAKMERLAQEAEAKAKAEREAEEALQREREELMARRQRSSALLKKVDAEAEAPAEESPAKPIEKASAPVAPAPAAAPAVEKKAPAEEAAPEYLNIFAEEEAPAPAAEDDGITVVFAEEVAEEAPVAEEAAEDVAEEAVPAEETAEEAEAPLTVEQIVTNDFERIAAEEKEKREREAEVAKAVDEALIRVRLAEMMPEHMIPESLRLVKDEVKEENAPGFAELIARLEGAVAAADRSGEARIADVLSRLEEMARRVEESMKAQKAAEAAEKSDAAAVAGAAAAGAVAGAAVAAAATAETPAEQIAAAAGADALPEAFGKEPFKRRELRRYLKATKAEIAQKKKEVKKLKREKGESKKDYQARRLEAEAALLGTQFGAIALLSYKGHDDAALSFKKDAEAGIRRYNKDVEKYNRVSKETCETLPEDLAEQIAKEGRLPENLPFGSAATGLDAAAPAGGDANVTALNAPEQQDLSDARKAELAQYAQQDKENRAEQKKLRKEMQNEMLMHALLWNPAAAAVIKKKASEKGKEGKEDAEMSAEAFRAAANSEERRARRAEKRAKRKEKNAKRQQELMDGYAAALSGKKKGKAAPAPYEPAAVRTGNGAAVDAFRLAASYDAFLSNDAEREAYYKNRLAMIDAKREEHKLLSKSTRALPKEARNEVAAAQYLDLIKDEVNLLCLLHRHPDEKVAARCQKDCVKDIKEYNRHAAKLDAEKINCKPLSALLPSQALRQGMDMPIGAWQQLDLALTKKDGGYKPSKEELAASYARVIAEDEKDREVIAAAAAGLTVEALRRESSASLKARAKVRAAIAKADAEYENAAAQRNLLLAECATLASQKKPKKKEIEALSRRIDELDAEAKAAAEKKEILDRARLAAETSTTLSPKEKAEMLNLALSVSKKGGRTADAERLEKITAAAAKAEAKAAKKAEKKNRRKEKSWENSIAATEAEALAAEDTAEAATERASRLYDEKGSSRMASDAYEQALLEESKAEEARIVADTVREYREDEEQQAASHDKAKNAMAAMALSAQASRRAKRSPLSEKKSKRIDTAIADAERDYDAAMEAYNAALERSRNLDANGASIAERDDAHRQCAALRAKAIAAKEKKDALCNAKATAENSTTMTEKQKAALVGLAVAASVKGDNRSYARLAKKTEAAAAKEAKVQAAADKKADRIRKNLDKQFSAAEAEALLSEGNAQAAREKADVLRQTKRDKKDLKKAYKEALLEEAKAEKAKQNAEQAQKERSEEEKAEKTAALAAVAAGAVIGKRAKKKADRKAAKKALEDRQNAEQLEAYARACEEKAADAEKQALLLAVEKGRKKEKLKAYEAAITERLEATKAREAADAAAKALAPETEADLLAQPVAEPLSKQRKAEERAALAEEKARMKKDAKEERRAEKQSRADKRLEKRARKDARAWQLLSERDTDLERRRSYLSALEQDKKDKARIAEQKNAASAKTAEAETVKAEAEKPEQKPETSRFNLSKRALKRKLKEFEKQDLKMLEARYDAAIAEEQRTLEIRLCDVSIARPVRKYMKRDSAKFVRGLKIRKRIALQAEKADNKRYFTCLRTALVPKNAKVNMAELAALRERLLAFLYQRDEQNARLLALYLGADGKAGRKKTPWHKAYLREKKRWQKKNRKTLTKIEELNLPRADKQKLRTAVDRVATSYADIAEAKCRAKRTKLKGAALRQHRQQLVEMEHEVRRARAALKRKMKAASMKEDQRSIVRTSIISTVILIVIVVACVAGWKLFGDAIWSFLDTNFPTVTAQLK